MRACDCPAARAAKWAGPLSEAIATWGIDTAARQAAFLAQIAHESGRLVYVEELWGPTLAQSKYEIRRDLGNHEPGDGVRFKGRGLIQITGRANYAYARDGMRKNLSGVPDFEAIPAAMAQPQWAAQSAGWYWASRGLSAMADAGNFATITRRINGGLNGQADRLALWDGAKDALGVSSA